MWCSGRNDDLVSDAWFFLPKNAVVFLASEGILSSCLLSGNEDQNSQLFRLQVTSAHF